VLRSILIAATVLAALLTATFAQARPVEEAYRGADSNVLAQVQNQFKAATESNRITHELIDLMDGTLEGEASTWPTILRAYRASLEGLLGKHSRIPWQKYTRVKGGLEGFRGLVEDYPNSIEIRSLRFAFYSQLPEVFGVREQGQEDLVALVDLLERAEDPTVTAAYRQDVARWILDNSRISREIRLRLEALLPHD